MKKVLNVIDDIVKYFLVLLVAAISILGMYQVVGRLFGHVPAWVEELIRFLFVWASCVGAAVGVKDHIHIGIDVLVNLLPQIGQRIIAIVVQVILCGFDVFLIKFGINLVNQTMKQPSAGLQIPMGYVYWAIPVLGGLGIFYSVREIVRLAKGEAKGEGELPIA